MACCAGVVYSTTLPAPSPPMVAVGECCAACRRTSNCNSFQYCAQKGGCRFPDGSASLPFGWCQLVHSGEVASGQGPTWVGWNATTPVISGAPGGGTFVEIFGRALYAIDICRPLAPLRQVLSHCGMQATPQAPPLPPPRLPAGACWWPRPM